jgi:hypothetical protein
MKHNKIPSYLTKVVCTDGSTFNIDFPYEKNDIFLTNDLKNNTAYLSPLLNNDSRGTVQKSKQKSLQFDFYSLMDKK